jgi:hypothetical protein
MPSKSRSRSPAKKKAPAAFDIMDHKDDIIALGLTLGLVIASGAKITGVTSLVKGLTGFCGGADESVLSLTKPCWKHGTILTLHTLNKVQGRGKKNWLADILDCMLVHAHPTIIPSFTTAVCSRTPHLIWSPVSPSFTCDCHITDRWHPQRLRAPQAVFASQIALGLIEGGTLGEAIMLGTEAEYTMVVILWYLTNHSIGGVVPNIWEMINDTPAGPAIQKVLALSSTVLINGLVIKAATSAEADALNLTGIALTPIIRATVVGAASSVVPAPDVSATGAALLGLMVSTKGFASVAVVGPYIDRALKLIPAPIGGSIGDLYANFLVVRTFFGGILGSLGVPSIVSDPLGEGVTLALTTLNDFVTKVQA